MNHELVSNMKVIQFDDVSNIKVIQVDVVLMMNVLLSVPKEMRCVAIYDVVLMLVSTIFALFWNSI